MPLILHVIADCSSDPAAASLMQTLQISLESWNPKPKKLAQRYWKIPETFEFLFDLAPPTVLTFDAIRALATGSWLDLEDHEERSSLWNRGSGESFLHEDVVWAELLLFP